MRRPTLPRPHPEIVAAVVVMAGLAALARLGWLDGLTIDDPNLVTVVVAVAAVGVAVVLLRPSLRWWTRTMAPLVAVVVVFELLAVWWLRASATVTDPYPPTFVVWIGAGLVVPGAVIAGWRRAGRPRRVVGLLAIPLTVAAAFLLINVHYGYWPTLGDLLGHPVAGQVSAATLHREVTSRPIEPIPRDTGRSSRERQVALPDHHDGALGLYSVVDIPATVSGFHHRPSGVYLPPAYFTAARPDLPVLVMLAGAPSGPSTLATAGGALATANRFAATHDGLAPVLLFADANGSWVGDTECVNGPRGQAETYLTVDVVHYATNVLHLTDDPSRWGIVGFSEGGTCALDLALRHPDEFRTFVDLAGDLAPNLYKSTLTDLYGGSTIAERDHDPTWLMSHDHYDSTTGWFGSGRRDSTHLRIGIRLDHEARAAGIQSSWFEGPGGHGFQFCTWAIRWLLPQLFARLDPQAGTVARAGTPGTV